MSINNLIPQHLQEELVQMGEDITHHTFRIGDIVLLLYDFVAVNEIACTKRDIWSAVGSLVGKAANTIQGYVILAEFYPPNLRKQYEVLSSNHFRAAMGIEKKKDISWKVILDYAIDRIDVYGRPATVDELYKVFLYGDAEYQQDDEEIISSQRDPVTIFIDLVFQLQRQIQLLPVDEAIRRELLAVVENLERVLAVV